MKKYKLIENFKKIEKLNNFQLEINKSYANRIAQYDPIINPNSSDRLFRYNEDSMIKMDIDEKEEDYKKKIKNAKKNRLEDAIKKGQ